MKKILGIVLVIFCLCACSDHQDLPKPMVGSGIRGEQFGIDENINEKTLDEYLGRDDVVYRDMRMLKDEAVYETVGGDSYLSGFVEGFEVVPYPYLVNVSGLPAEVGESYQGPHLFTYENDNYVANYQESMAILEYLFPKDKAIFLMCGGGGYAGMTKNMLISLGWDEDKLYNVGGFWFYEGNKRVEVKREENGQVYYDFYKVAYHDIDFNSLTPLNNNADGEKDTDDDYSLAEINSEKLDELLTAKGQFALFLYLPGCTSCAAFKPIVKELSDSNQLAVFAMSLDEAKKNAIINNSGVKYTPSLMLIEDGEVVDYLDATADEDIPYYENVRTLSEWIGNYFPINSVNGESQSSLSDCPDGCEY